LHNLGIIDEILPEPLGGAQRGRQEAIDAVGDAIERNLFELCRHDGATLRQKRRDKFLEMGSKRLS